MQQIVRRFNFTTGGKEHEVVVMSHGKFAKVNVDERPVGQESMEGSNEMLFPFNVDVPGMPAVDGFLSMEKVQGTWQYMLVVKDIHIDPWWTLERGDSPDAQPKEVLDVSSFAQWEAPASSNVQTIHDHQEVVLQAQSPPQGQDKSKRMFPEEVSKVPELVPPPRTEAPRSSWMACCAAPAVPAPEVMITREMMIAGEMVSRPRSVALNKQPPETAAFCAPHSDRDYKDRPVAKSCSDGGQVCYGWAEEVFTGH
jgi:hypothetical protein